MSEKRMRINLKIVCWLVIVATFLTTISYWTKCGETPMSHTSVSVLSRMAKYSIQELQKEDAYGEEVGSVTPNGFHKDLIGNDNSVISGGGGGGGGVDATEQIECLINGEYTVGCRRDGHEVYVPFTFLHKYFEVYGKVASVDGHDRFEWQHSYSKYYNPKSKYDPGGVFMNFENFNVEARDRVKCISAMDGVPVSTQWDIRGYLYPIQIAQFALSHFSKNFTESKARVSILEDGERYKAKWSTPDGSVEREFDKDSNSEVLHFSTSESLQSPGIALSLDQTQDFVLSMNLRLQSNGSVTVLMEDRERRERYHLHYVCSRTYISAVGNHIYYGMGERSEWGRLTRDLAVDLRKGTNLVRLSRKVVKSHGKFRLLGVTLRGQGSLDNLTLATSAHLAHFSDACEWLLRHQDERGGWPIPVERKFNAAGMSNLAPGWYSAMAQGQAMSALTRAFRVTGEERFRAAALKAVELFAVSSEDNGVLARFLDKHDWYEEYPTVPGSFVLNGFMYALIGLYDVRHSCGGGEDAMGGGAAAAAEEDAEECRRRADALYEQGMSSLKTVLPLFDSGVGSFYDLRHFTLGIAPNLARWDYHTTHIGQLLLLSTVDSAAVLKSTANRWIEYMKGKRAPHN